MILFLRNEKNRTIAEVDCYVKTEDDRKFVELHATVDILYYSRFLLQSINDPFVWAGEAPTQTQEIIDDFYEISELRGWLWEVYQDTEPENYNDIIKILREKIIKLADKYNLRYVED